MPRVGDTRTKILEVAEAEFASEGYAGAHLQKIAEQVGVRKTALYYYFDSKAALYTDGAQGDARGLRSLHRRRCRDQRAAERQLEELVARVNDLLAEHPNYARILLRVFVDRRTQRNGRRCFPLSRAWSSACCASSSTASTRAPSAASRRDTSSRAPSA